MTPLTQYEMADFWVNLSPEVSCQLYEAPLDAPDNLLTGCCEDFTLVSILNNNDRNWVRQGFRDRG